MKTLFNKRGAIQALIVPIGILIAVGSLIYQIYNSVKEPTPPEKQKVECQINEK
jgi:uncharacterized membrane protein YebE (DUF533 family)